MHHAMMVIAADPPRIESPATTASSSSSASASLNGCRTSSVKGGITTRKNHCRPSNGVIPEHSPGQLFESDVQVAEFLSLLAPPSTPGSLHSRKKKVISNSGGVGVLRTLGNIFKRGGAGSKCDSKPTDERTARTVLALTPSQFPSVEANEVFQEIHRMKENGKDFSKATTLRAMTVSDLRGISMNQKALSQPSLEMSRSSTTNPASMTQASTTNRTLRDSLHQSIPGLSITSTHVAGNSNNDCITLPPPTSVSARRSGSSDAVSVASAGKERQYQHHHQTGSVISRTRNHGPRGPPRNLPIELETNSERAKRHRYEIDVFSTTDEYKTGLCCNDYRPALGKGMNDDGSGNNGFFSKRILEQIFGPSVSTPTPATDTSSRSDTSKICQARTPRFEAPLYPSLQEIQPPPVFTEPRAEVEISPGFFLPLRGSKETLWAIQNGRIATTTCVCGILLHCVQDAAFVLCPDCRVIGPMECHGGSSCTPEGVGLGFKPEQLTEWRSIR